MKKKKCILLVLFSTILLFSCANYVPLKYVPIRRESYTYSATSIPLNVVDNGIILRKGDVYISGGVQKKFGNTKVTRMDSGIIYTDTTSIYNVSHFYIYNLLWLANLEMGAGLNDYISVGMNITGAFGKYVIPKRVYRYHLKENLIWSDGFVRVNLPLGKFNMVMRYDRIGSMASGYNEIVTEYKVINDEDSSEVFVEESEAYGFRTFDVGENATFVIMYRKYINLSYFVGFQIRKVTVEKNLLFENKKISNAFNIYLGSNIGLKNGIVLSPYITYSIMEMDLFPKIYYNVGFKFTFLNK
ncbi:MAG: hypothetical protein H0Z29_07250 [Candidatus Marinimicrobia bacterium]|nr:hypothetical protein [Candidatus Neomarinimicrobiota bacterium]